MHTNKINAFLGTIISISVCCIYGCGNSTGSSSGTVSVNSSSSVSGQLSILSAGSYHSVFLKSDGTVWGWGDNTYGELGDKTNTNRTIPVQAAGLSGIIAVAAGNGFTLALKNDGTVWGWGENLDGELGDATTINRNAPVQTMIQERDISGNLMWEQDSKGNTILDTSGNRIPVLVVFSGVTAISAGDGFSVALRNDGTVWT